MSITFYAAIASQIEQRHMYWNETGDQLEALNWTIDNIQPYYNKHDTFKIVELGTINMNSETGKEIVQIALTNNIFPEALYEQVLPLIKHIADPFYLEWTIVIKPNNLKNVIANSTNTAKTKFGKKYQDLYNPDSWVTRPTFLKRYYIKGFVKNIPYSNYNNNDVENLCVWEYVKKQYPKLSTKKIKESFNKENVTIEDIQKFTDEYKIKCSLFNIDGKSLYYNNISDDDKKYDNFTAILCNNHLYPKNNETDLLQPTINNAVLKENNIDLENDIYFKEGTKTIGKTGIFDTKVDDKTIDASFFKLKFPNFMFECEDKLKMKSLLFNDISLNITPTGQFARNLVFEIDLNKAYYTVASSIISKDSIYPIFSVTDTYDKFNDDHVIDYCYYLISEAGLKLVKDYGIITNSITGFMLDFLLSKKLLELSHVKYIKKPSYTNTWGEFIKCLDKLANDNMSEEDKKDPNKLAEFKKEFALYNGILGRTREIKERQIFNLKQSEAYLLNSKESGLKWEPHNCEDEYTIFTKRSSSFRYINNCNMYNHIISHCAMFVLKTLLAIKKLNPNCELVKMTTDSLGFTKEIIIPEEFKQYYKIVPVEKMYGKERIIKQVFHSGKEIIKEINEELKCFKNNVSYHGAPGTGKTTIVRENHSYDYAITWTNLCSLNLSDEHVKGTTVYKELSLFSPENIHKNFSKFRNKTIWIDEYSMIGTYIWNYIFILSRMYNVKFIISGDLGQIPPINDQALTNTTTFFKRLMGKSTTLTKDWRNDEELQKLRSLVQTEQNLNQLFKNLESKDDYTLYTRHISFCHTTRRDVNNEILKKNGYVFKVNNYCVVENGKKIFKYKSLDVSVGVILSVRVTETKDDLFKGDLWVVIQKDKYSYELKNILRKNIEDKSDIIKTFSMDLMQYFTVGFCTTAHSSQGLTIKDYMCIHDVDMMIYRDRKILYTAVTRGCEFKKVRFYGAHKCGPKDKLYKDVFIDLEKDEEYDLWCDVKAVDKNLL